VKYYYLLYLIFIFFTILITFIFRNSSNLYVNKSEEILINEHLLTTLVNVLVLSLGILITILTSFVRFKNYREILEELREKQNIMIGYIDKYNKQKNNLEFLYQTKEDDIKIEEIEKIKNDIAEYDTILVSTNILQFLTTQDIIKFNNFRLEFEFKKKEILFNYNKKFKMLEKADEENQPEQLTKSNKSFSPSSEFIVL